MRDRCNSNVSMSRKAAWRSSPTKRAMSENFTREKLTCKPSSMCGHTGIIRYQSNVVGLDLPVKRSISNSIEKSYCFIRVRIVSVASSFVETTSAIRTPSFTRFRLGSIWIQLFWLDVEEEFRTVRFYLRLGGPRIFRSLCLAPWSYYHRASFSKSSLVDFLLATSLLFCLI